MSQKEYIAWLEQELSRYIVGSSDTMEEIVEKIDHVLETRNDFLENENFEEEW